jgi:hypothetical protein
MPRPLVPAPADLGLASPALGPWFDDAGITLGRPNDDLSVTVTPGGTARWLPPARGILSLHFATPTRSKALAPLRAANGGKAFTENRLVALFRLLPEVEARLEALAEDLPSPDGAAAAVPTRPAVRWFALEATGLSTASTAAAIIAGWANGFASDENTEAKKLAALGLAGMSGALANADKPASVLLGPGQTVGSGDELLLLDTSGYRLSAFDRRGRPIDPGAVASWWRHLATTVYDNLWAGGVASRTCPATAQRTLHLVSAHEGPVPAVLLARANIGGVGGAPTDVLRAASGPTAVTVGFTGPSDPDDAPVPRAALLPHGAYGASLSLWPAGPVAAGIERDYVRIALIDVESHLTGQPRTPASTTPTAGERRRAADQNRPSTRVEVARADAGGAPIRPDIDAAADALVTLLQGPAPSSLVTPQLDRDFGPLPELAADADPLPGALPTPTVRALVGGGTASGGTIARQRVLVELGLDPPLAGAWLRLWPNSVDLASGRRKASDGGAGRVRGDGRVSLVVLLPDGADAATELGATAVLAHGGATRLYGEVRFTRPLAAGGTAIGWGSAGGAILACEQERFASTAAVTGLLPGTTLVHDDGVTASLIDPPTVPASAYAAPTVVRALAAGDFVLTTRPAFRTEPTGSPAATLAATGAAATEQARDGVNRPTGPGTPLPGQEALTSAAVALDETRSRAVLVPPPALSRYHEIGAAQFGHPGAPATEEQAGAGVDLIGPAALLFAEAVSAIADPATPAFAAAAVARTMSPIDPSGASLWAAALRTQAAGVEGERGLHAEVVDAAAPFPFDGDEAALRHWYAANPSITIPAPPAGRQAAQQRALARRALAAGRGLRECADALAAAFARAEDFVYVETPSLDLLDIGSGDEHLRPVQALAARLAAQPALHASVCVPVEAFSGAPKDYARVRADTTKAALAALAAAAPGRFVSFCPSAGAGRSLRLLTTTVVVDDMFALVGSTHLSRRGLSFDSSLAAALFDERNVRGRGQALVDLRLALLAARLALPTSLVPEDGPAVVKAIGDLAARGSARVTAATLPPVDPPVTDTERRLWNRDGTVASDPADLAAWLTQLATGNVLS